MDILSAENIKKSFDEKVILDGVNLTLRQGELISLLGVSGAGKTTLFNCISGIDRPDSGRVVLDGQDITGQPGHISYMLQKDLLLPYKKIIDNVSLPLLLSGKSKKEARTEAGSHFAQFGLEGTQQQYPAELSGGMRQRVLIAMGIAAGADLVLADEPTKGLDRRRIALVEDAFQRLGERTLLCVTHDLRFAHAISSRVVVMYASQQIESGDSPSFFAEPLHPYSRAMLEALPENGLHANMGFAPPRQDVDAQSVCHFYGRCPWRSERCRKAPPLMTVGKRKVRCWKYAD